MSTSTPNEPSSSNSAHKRSTSQSRGQTPPPRPATPLRPPSRGSLRSSQTPSRGDATGGSPLDALEPAFAELSDGMADLEANFMHLQLMHESLSRFSECFASFLHGMKLNAFCVDFPEAPIPESFQRAMNNPRFAQAAGDLFGVDGAFERSAADNEQATDPDQTFLTTDTSFVENPPTSSVKASTTASKFSTPRKRGATNTAASRAARGASATMGATRGGSSRGRASGLARATSRGRGGLD
ncbi:MAG: DASH complex subunit dam1 [Alyxoria varia]|nr:MAG: DASH complex subunit dam1 [Alyxoria varia]